jgi:hypothetical protein
MENKTTFELPVFEKESKEKGKPGPKQKATTVEKPLLPSINREVKCVYCEESRTMGPAPYQKKFDYYGSEEAIARHFQCQECETAEKTNPFKFHLEHSDVVNNLANNIRPIFERYNNSGKQQQDVLNLQSYTDQVLGQAKVFAPNYEFLITNGLPDGLKINFPFVGKVIIRPLEFTKVKKISVE